MKRLHRTIKAFLVVQLVLGLPLGALHAAPQYIINDLGTLGGAYSNGIAINEAGQVAGYSYKLGNAELHPFLWQSGAAIQDLNTLGGIHAMAVGINSAGQVVGNSSTTGNSVTRGFVWNVGGMSQLSTLGGTRSRATSINNNGIMTGAASIVGDTAEHAVVWPTSLVIKPTDLGTLGGVNSQGNDINVNGQVVGYAENTTHLTHATLWTPPYSAVGQDLGTLGGTYSQANAINAGGQVTGVSTIAGDAQFRGFVWQAGQGMVDIGTLTATSTQTAGMDINTNGDIVGYSTTAGGGAKRAIIRKNGSTVPSDLNGQILTGTGWVLSEASGINDSGQIVGVGTLTKVDTAANLNRVEHHAFLLAPDRVKPTITCPGTVTTTGAQPVGIGQAIATDNLDPSPTVTNNRPATFPVGDTTVIWSATDANGNTANCSQLVTIGGDTTPPVVNFTIAPVTPTASGWYTGITSVTWSVTDAQSAITSPACTNIAAVPNTTAAGQVYSCTATSTGGTTGPISTPAIKVDALAPVMSNVPVAFTQQATSTTGAVVNYTTPTASDAHSGIKAPGVTCLPTSGSVFPMGATTVNCTVGDKAGNTSLASFVATVADRTPPVIAPTINGLAGLAGWYRGTGVTVSWSVNDGESAVTSPVCATVAALNNTANQVFSCTGISAGGTATGSTNPFGVDSGLPTFAAFPANITVNATSATGAVVTFTLPTASDTLSGIAPSGVSCATATGLTAGSTFPIGTNAVVCSVSDRAGNIRNRNLTITVNAADSTPPVITPTITGTLGQNGWYTGPVSVSWSATDAESAITSSACATGNALLNAANQNFSCTATSTGGSATVTRTVSVDSTAPTLAGVPVTFTVAATSSTGATATYGLPAASDALSGVSVAGVSCAPASGSTFAIGNTTVNCSARDNAGNHATASFVLTVADQTAPVFTSCPATVTLTQGQALPQLTATDNVSVPVVTRTPAGTLGLGTTAVTWTATDQAGLAATCLQQVTVNAAITETINVIRSQCKRISATSGEWLVQGTSSIVTNNTIQLYSTAAVPTDLTANKLGAALTVSSKGDWQYQAKPGPACATPISLRSSATATQKPNVAVIVQ